MRRDDKLAIFMCRLFRNFGSMEPLGPVQAGIQIVFMPFAGISLVVNLRQGGTREAGKRKFVTFKHIRKFQMASAIM